MNVQLFPSNYQGNPIDVPCQDPNALCQYLYDFAQNQLQTIVQLGYQLPDQSSGVVDPQWPIGQLLNAGASFLVMVNQDGNVQQTGNAGEITLNIYVNDQQVTTMQANIQQQLQEILAYVNQNMQSQFNTLELYDSTGTGLSNSPLDYIGSYAQAQAPFLLFIPGCGSGIQNFVSGMPSIPPQVNIPPQPNLGGLLAPSPLVQEQQKQQSQNSEQRIKEAKESFKVQKNFSLFIDQQGEFVIYKFHHPVMFSGTLKKSTSKPKKNFLESNYDFVAVSKIRFAETDDYSFAVKWDNGNISTVKITQQ